MRKRAAEARVRKRERRRAHQFEQQLLHLFASQVGRSSMITQEAVRLYRALRALPRHGQLTISVIERSGGVLAEPSS
jgi:hypothetical protein